MRKSVVFLATLVAVIALASTAFAKEKGATKFAKKGTWTVSGDVAFQMHTEEYDNNGGETDYTQFTLAPGIGYFLMNSLELRVSPVIETTKEESGNSESKTNAYGIKAGAWYYYPMQGTLYLGGGGDLGYLTGEKGGIDVGTFLLDLGAGVTISFGKNFGGFVSLNALFQYRSNSYDVAGSSIDSSDTGFGIMSGFGIFL